MRGGRRSLFRMAVGSDGISDEECEWIRKLPTPETLPFAFLAVWLRDFYHRGNGGDFLQSCWHYQAHHQIETLRYCWQAAFGKHACLDNDSFKAQCWLLQHDEENAVGGTSELWRGLQLCLGKLRNERFEPASYDDPPGYLRLLLEARQRGDASGNDFAEFVGVLSGESSYRQGEWYQELYETCCQRFDRPTLGVYFHWDGNLSLGLGIGVEHSPGGEPVRLRLDGSEWSVSRAVFFRPVFKRTKTEYAGATWATVDPSLDGVYYRYKKTGARSNWWKRLAPEEAVPCRNSQLLVRLPGGTAAPAVSTEGGVKVESRGVQEIRVQQGDNSYRPESFLSLEVVSRPFFPSKVRVSGIADFLIAPQSPSIEIRSGVQEGLSSDAFMVCSGDCVFEVCGVDPSDGASYDWRCDFPCRTERNRLFLQSDRLENGDGKRVLKVRVQCRFRNGEKECAPPCEQTVVWLPVPLAQALRNGEPLDEEECGLSKVDDSEEVIENRLSCQVAYRLRNPCRSLEYIYAHTEAFAFWFERGWKEVRPLMERVSFDCLEELDRWSVCFPYDVGGAAVQGRREGDPRSRRNSREWLPEGHVGKTPGGA